MVGKWFRIWVIGTLTLLHALMCGLPAPAQLIGIALEREFVLQEEFSAGAALPLILSDGRTVILSQFFYQKSVYPYDEWNLETASTAGEETLHQISLFLMLVQRLSERVGLVAGAEPTIGSDLDQRLSSDDFYLDMLAGVQFYFAENLTVGPVVRYTTGDRRPFPLVMLYWRPHPRWTVTGMLPDDLSVICRISSFLDVGLHFEYDLARYHGSQHAYRADDPRLFYQQATVGPTVQMNLKPWLHLKLEGGYAFGRSFTVRDGRVKVESVKPEPAYYLKAGFLMGR